MYTKRYNAPRIAALRIKTVYNITLKNKIYSTKHSYDFGTSSRHC